MILKPKIKRTIIIGLLSLEIIIFLLIYIYGSYGLREISVLKKENNQLQGTITQLQQDIADCKVELENISHPFYKEKIAREQLQMAHKDDIVILLK